VEILFVRAANEVAHQRDGAVGHDLHRFFHADRAEIARHGAEVFDDLVFPGETVILQAGELADLDLVHLVVAAQQ
jgi:hypothetical protein